MRPNVVEAYYQEGYRLLMGSPRVLVSGVEPIDHRLRISDGTDQLPPWLWGMTLRDMYLFELIGRELNPDRAMVIGNAYGIGVNSIGDALRPVRIDAIDAETDGEWSAHGSELTRRVASRLGIDLKLTKGWSPRDIDEACRFDEYDLCFIDGEHTNEQMLADFDGIRDRLADRCAVVFHDVGQLGMQPAWQQIRRDTAGEGFAAHEVTFTDVGTCVLLRGMPELSRMLSITCHGFYDENVRYHAGTAVFNHPSYEERIASELAGWAAMSGATQACLIGCGNNGRLVARACRLARLPIEARDDDPEAARAISLHTAEIDAPIGHDAIAIVTPLKDTELVARVVTDRPVLRWSQVDRRAMLGQINRIGLDAKLAEAG